MTASPLVEVQYSSDAGNWHDTPDGVDVGAGDTVQIRLKTPFGASKWFLKIFGVDEVTLTPPTLTGVSGGQVITTSTVVTFTMPAGLGKALVFKSSVDSGGAGLVSTFGIYTLTYSGFRVGAIGERLEGSQTFGWSRTINPFIRLGGGAGFQGFQGRQGNQGNVGTGAQGNTGIQGNQGGGGVQGNQGRQGNIGTGAQGNQGGQGGTGTQGTQGDIGTGSQGGQGGTGTQGTQGNQGRQGTSGTGAQGNQGNTGVQGNHGVQGNQGTGVQGFQGTNPGPQGNQGTNPGPQGNQGNDATGVQGNQGWQGSGGGGGGTSMIFVAGVSTQASGTPTRMGSREATASATMTLMVQLEATAGTAHAQLYDNTVLASVFELTTTNTTTTRLTQSGLSIVSGHVYELQVWLVGGNPAIDKAIITYGELS